MVLKFRFYWSFCFKNVILRLFGMRLRILARFLILLFFKCYLVFKIPLRPGRYIFWIWWFGFFAFFNFLILGVNSLNFRSFMRFPRIFGIFRQRTLNLDFFILFQSSRPKKLVKFIWKFLYIARIFNFLRDFSLLEALKALRMFFVVQIFGKMAYLSRILSINVSFTHWYFLAVNHLFGIFPNAPFGK